jgi:hypothetical protein
MSSFDGFSTPVLRSHAAYLSRFCGLMVGVGFNFLPPLERDLGAFGKQPRLDSPCIQTDVVRASRQ